MMEEERNAFPIVGIGASAGGVEALEAVFTHVPAGIGCAFVVVTHLSPHGPSLLPEIIARHAALPVQHAKLGTVVRLNTIYVLPSHGVLRIVGGVLTLRPADPSGRDRKLIDVFLGSLAEDQGDYAVGIILSGGDGDGTLGIKAIKERGGLTMAQIADGTPPQHPDMPNSAIASGMVDFAIPADQMGAQLAAYARSLGLLDHVAATNQAASLDHARRAIQALLRSQTGHDFSGYKERGFLRRVHRRMQVNGLEAIEAYVALLREDPREAPALFRDLLISVTNFFRDEAAFAALAETVIPKLLEGRTTEDVVRVWVPACATGEEVFSIAILLREQMDRLGAHPRVQIFATDIHDDALHVARAGRYPEALLEGVSPERRRRFFTAADNSYRLIKEVRDMCIFSPHNLLRDPPLSRLDLVSCRNLLIYFGPDAQSQALPTFHYALRPGGYLFLGASENVSQFADLFTPVDKAQRIFRAREDAASALRVRLLVGGPRPPTSVAAPPPGLSGIALRQAIEARVLERFAPAHAVVNAEGDVVHYSARTGRYLEHTAGAPSRQIVGMARKGLRLELRTALRDAVESQRRVTREALAVEQDGGGIQSVKLTIEPLAGPGEAGLYLIVLADIGPALGPDDLPAGTLAPEDATAHLERDLRESRERLQSLIEEYETALEELKSLNEELVSVNEELQSANEEMEASKEELQSVNEELHTVNAELIGKVDQLDRANSDLQNLFESTQVATVFLDRNLVIRSYTPAMANIFNLRPGDRGRPLTDLAGRFDLPNLPEDVAEVFAGGQSIERQLARDQGRTHYLLRLAPYRDSAAAPDGVVLTFVDVTSLTESQARQRVLIAELNHRVKNMLAVVISVAEQTWRSSPTAEFRPRFTQRVQAIARSYELLSRAGWAAAAIGDLLRPQLAAFDLERVSLAGPECLLGPKQALSLGMVVHELATNAARFGALSSAAGTLEIGWQEQPSGSAAPSSRMLLHWREQGGPPAAPPEHRGFGLRLIEQETAYGLNGEATLVFNPEGLVATIAFPLPPSQGAGLPPDLTPGPS